ncbi:MAG TPA: HAMP domain-containing protein, partial [Candidatus Saccharimonadales bacterium]
MSIRKKLTILMLAIGLLPTAVIGAVSFATTSNELSTKTTEQLVSSVSKQEQKISGLLQLRQEDVSTLTNRFDLQSALGQYLSTGNESDRATLDTIIADNKTQTPDIQSITITDLNGRVLATTVDENRGKTLKPDDYYIPPNSSANITISEDENDSIDKLNITTQLSVNKKASGIIKVVFRIDDIVAAVQDYTGLGATGETVVASKDKAGNSISLFPLRFDTDAALTKSLNSLGLFDPTDTTKTVVDYRGKKVLVAPRTVGFADWVIATKIDLDEALAPIIQLRNTLIITLILSSVVIMLIAVWLTEFFTKPILYIANAAQLIGKGDFSARVNLKRNDEIGILGSSINTMGASLKDFVAHIETERNQLEVILNSATESILAIDKQGTVLIAN